MKAPSKVLCIGEMLIDFMPSAHGVDLKDVPAFARAAGGAPANVAAAVSKLGGNSAIVTKLGADPFGDYLVSILEHEGVETDKVLRTAVANTALAFVSLKSNGERDFSFYRNPSADMLLEASEIKAEWLSPQTILHFCSVGLIEAPIKYAHLKAIEYAHVNQSLISFDLNVRLPLWPNASACRKALMDFIPKAHIIKLSDEELAFLTGSSDIEAAKSCFFDGACKLLILTKGGEGAEIITKNATYCVEGIKTEVVDTTGAGDSFIGSFLYQLAHDGISIETLDHLSDAWIQTALEFSNAYASVTTEKKGAIDSMLTMAEWNQRKKAE